MNNSLAMKKYIFISSLLILLNTGFGQLVPGGIIRAFEKGDAKELAQYFNANIELQLPENSQVTSKNQATRIMQDFFKEHQPLSFKLEYEGTKQDSRYGLGTLVTRNGTYSVNLYFMDGKEEKFIYFMSIEKA